MLAALLLAAATTPPGDAPALAAATRAMCGRRTVMLGEGPTHGAGHTDAFKAALVERLVQQCGFRGLAWEASFYEFADIAAAVRRRQMVTAGRIGDAIGGLWKFDREILPLLPFLADRVNTDRLRIGGLDDQIGGLEQPFSTDAMAEALTAPLPPVRRAACREALRRRIYSDYPDGVPGAAERDGVLGCLSDMERTAPTKALSPVIAAADRAAFLRNMRAALTPDPLDAEDYFAARDRQMATNLAWWRARWPRGTKVIVWCATVHAARPVTAADGRREPIPDGLPSAPANMGGQVARRWPGAFVLAFTAQGGAVRVGRKREQPVPAPEPGALEAASIPSGQEAAFLGPSALAQLGQAPGAAFTGAVTTVRWRDALDGVVVFRREWPAHSTRPGY